MRHAEGGVKGKGDDDNGDGDCYEGDGDGVCGCDGEAGKVRMAR